MTRGNNDKGRRRSGWGFPRLRDRIFRRRHPRATDGARENEDRVLQAIAAPGGGPVVGVGVGVDGGVFQDTAGGQVNGGGEQGMGFEVSLFCGPFLLCCGV